MNVEAPTPRCRVGTCAEPRRPRPDALMTNGLLQFTDMCESHNELLQKWGH